MSLRDPKALYDGIQAITGGMNSGVAASAIGRGQVSFARNVTFRGGFPMTRPGWLRRVLTFENATTQTRFEDGLFQGASSFEPFQGGVDVMSMISGRLFKIEVDNRFIVTDLSEHFIPADLNPSARPKAWMEDAEGFHITQDGQSSPLIYDGATLRRVSSTSNPKEIPVGTVVHYSNGRLTVVLPNRKSFVMLDLVGGPSGTPTYQYRDAILKNTENEFLTGGGEFGLPFNGGEIRSVRGLAVQDTSLGQGPTQVLAERGVVSINAPFDRIAWHDLEYPIETVSLIGSGAQSHEGSVLVNGDIWFRSRDGIRSFQVARRDQGTWVNTPLSTEMHEVIRHDDTSLLEHSSATLFDNRYLVTASPFRVADHGIAHRGVIALDFHNVSGIGVRSTPVYDGLWTGLNILQFVAVQDRCFLLVLTAANKIELWELTKDAPFDNGTTRIAAFLDTPAFGFEDAGLLRKELSTGDVWFSDLVGTVNFTASFRPDNHHCFIDWHSWSVDSKRESCLTEVCAVPDSLAPQYRPRMRLPLPSESCNVKPNMPYRHGFQHQMRLAWTGHARIDRLRVVAHDLQEDTVPYCEPSEATDTTGVTCCDTSLYAYTSAP